MSRHSYALSEWTSDLQRELDLELALSAPLSPQANQIDCRLWSQHASSRQFVVAAAMNGDYGPLHNNLDFVAFVRTHGVSPVVVERLEAVRPRAAMMRLSSPELFLTPELDEMLSSLDIAYASAQARARGEIDIAIDKP